MQDCGYRSGIATSGFQLCFQCHQRLIRALVCSLSWLVPQSYTRGASLEMVNRHFRWLPLRGSTLFGRGLCAPQFYCVAQRFS